MMQAVKLPRLYGMNVSLNEHGEQIHPVRLSVDLSLTPVSTASIELPIGEEIGVRRFVEIFTSIGSVGFFRARGPQMVFGEGTSTTELEHAIAEVGDKLVRTKVEGEMTIRAAMRAVFANYNGSMWQLGSLAALNNSSSNTIDVSYDHEDVLSAMLSVLEYDEDVCMDFDFSTTPWTINFRKIDDTTGVTEGRLTTNIGSASVTYDDTDLCTVAYYQYEGGNWGYVSASSLYPASYDKYGGVHKTVDTESGDSQAVAKTKAKKFLARNHEPKVSIEIQGDDIHAITGNADDELYLGRMYRLVIPDYNLRVERYITGLSWDDVLGNPTAVTVTLGDDDPALWGYLRSLTKKKK